MRVLFDGRPCIVDHIESLTEVMVFDELREEHLLTSPSSLMLPTYGKTECPDAPEVTEKEIDVAALRTASLMPYVRTSKRISAAEMSQLETLTGLHRTRIYECLSLLRKSPSPNALVRRKRGVRKGNRRLPSDVEQIIKREIQSATKSSNALQIETIQGNIELACDKIGKKVPCKKTIRARIYHQRYELLLRRKYGKRRAVERTRALPGTITTTAALDLVEIDHSPLDIILVSSDTREPIGRAYLTIVIDTYTRAILGFHLGLDEPQELSVALAIVHAVLPKEAWLAEHGLSNVDWPMYGLMRSVRLDGGSEFKSSAFRSACRKWGIEIQYRGKKEDGAIIERAIGTIQSRASQEPGATGSDPKKKRREKDPASDAQMTLFEAEKWLAREIAQRYHLQTHDGIGMSPRQAWTAGHTTANGIVLPTIVTDAKDLLLSFLPEEKHVISHDGIHAFTERYFTHELVPYVKPGLYRPVKYDPRGIGKVFVDCDTGTYIEVPFADPTKPNLPLFEHKWRRKQKRLKYPTEYDAEARRRYLKEQDADRRASRTTTREARRNERLLQAAKATGNAGNDDKNERMPRDNDTERAISIDYSIPAAISQEGEI